MEAYNSVNGDGMTKAVNLHMAGKVQSDNPAKPYSRGCITVEIVHYRDFGVATGFIKDLETNHLDGFENKYTQAKQKLLYDENAVKDFEGYIVIDRKYYNAEMKAKYL